MIIIDGSAGEGGGQVLRTALGLSLATGKPFQINNIRGKRKKPGLLRQHLTAVRAATEIGQAKVSGDEMRSASLSFAPSTVKSGKYDFSVGTAGSCTLVFQAILPALLMADAESEITIEGGTHNPMAPPFDFLATTFLPLLEKMGATIKAELIRPGFVPAGGGKMCVRVAPVKKFQPLDLCLWNFSHFTVRAVCAELQGTIGLRELKTVQTKLGLEQEGELLQLDQYGPGNVVIIHAHSANFTETFTGFGQKNVRAERVASRVAGQAGKYLKISAPVGPYLADQLLIPMALAGAGQFVTAEPTQHTLTNIEVIEKFCAVTFQLDRLNKQQWKISVTAKS